MCSCDFEVNQTKIKVGCQLGREVVPHDSKSDLPLIPIINEKTRKGRRGHFLLANYNVSPMALIICELSTMKNFRLWFYLKNELYWSFDTPFNNGCHHCPMSKVFMTSWYCIFIFNPKYWKECQSRYQWIEHCKKNYWCQGKKVNNIFTSI